MIPPSSDADDGRVPPKPRSQFSLAHLLKWTTGAALWLAVLKCSGSWQFAMLLGLCVMVVYLDLRFSLRFPDRYLLTIVAALIVLGTLMAFLFPAVR